MITASMLRDIASTRDDYHRKWMRAGADEIDRLEARLARAVEALKLIGMLHSTQQKLHKYTWGHERTSGIHHGCISCIADLVVDDQATIEDLRARIARLEREEQ